MTDFKKRLMWEVAIIMGIVVLFGAFSYLFRANIVHKTTQITDLKAKSNELLRGNEDLGMLLQGEAQAQQYKNLIASKIPRRDDLLAVPKNLQSISKSNNVALDFAFGKENSQTLGADIGSIEFTAGTTGTWGNIAKFLGAFEENYYALRIDSFDITDTNPDESRGTTVRASFSGQLFFVQ